MSNWLAKELQKLPNPMPKHWAKSRVRCIIANSDNSDCVGEVGILHVYFPTRSGVFVPEGISDEDAYIARLKVASVEIRGSFILVTQEDHRIWVFRDFTH